MKIEVKLRDDLADQGLGFTDIDGKQEIRHKSGKTLEVKQTIFVNEKIRTGELVVVGTPKDGGSINEPEPKDKAKK